MAVIFFFFCSWTFGDYPERNASAVRVSHGQNLIEAVNNVMGKPLVTKGASLTMNQLHKYVTRCCSLNKRPVILVTRLATTLKALRYVARLCKSTKHQSGHNTLTRSRM